MENSKLSYISDLLTKDHYKLVLKFFSDHGYVISGTKDIYKNGRLQDKDMVFNQFKRMHLELHCDYDRALSEYYLERKIVNALRVRYPAPRLSVGELEAVFSQHLEYTHIKALQDTRERLKCEKEDLAPVSYFIELLTTRPPKEEDVCAFAHSLWLVKRGLFRLKRHDHHMFILLGGQRLGKSEAMQRVFGPLSEFRINTSLDNIVDPAFVESRAYHLIQFVDEMSGYSKKSTVEHLKDVITNPNYATRRVYGRYVSQFQNWATYFGCSNTPVSAMIRDSSGMRRFYELEVNPNFKNNWDKVNSMDFEAMWKGVDEKLEYGYVGGKYEEVGNRVREIKEKYTDIDIKEQFVEDMNVVYTKGMKVRPVLNSVIMARFKDYLKVEGVDNAHNNKITMQHISHSLQRRGFEKTRTLDGRGWLLNDDCLFGQSEHGSERKVTHIKKVK